MPRLTPIQSSTLDVLTIGALTMKEVADCIDRDARTAGHVINALMRRSLVTVDETYGHVRYVLTQRGRRHASSLGSRA